MSRTYRRTKSSAEDGYRKEWETHDWVRAEGTLMYIRVKKEGKEFKKGLARFHSDRDYHISPSVWWRKNEWRKIKAQEKQELIRWMKNPDHEVQMHEHPRWPWWD